MLDQKRDLFFWSKLYNYIKFNQHNQPLAKTESGFKKIEER